MKTIYAGALLLAGALACYLVESDWSYIFALTGFAVLVIGLVSQFGMPSISLGGMGTYAKPFGVSILVGALIVGLLTFGSTDWIPKRLPYSGSEMFALVWPNLLLVLGAWAIVAILFAVLGRFNFWGAKVGATMQTIAASGFIILIVGGALVAFGTWMSGGTSNTLAATQPHLMPGESQIIVPALGRSTHITVPHGQVVVPTMPGGVKLRCLMDGREYTAWEDWPKDGMGRYKGGNIPYCYFQNLENRSAFVQYRFAPPS